MLTEWNCATACSRRRANIVQFSALIKLIERLNKYTNDIYLPKILTMVISAISGPFPLVSDTRCRVFFSLPFFETYKVL